MYIQNVDEYLSDFYRPEIEEEVNKMEKTEEKQERKQSQKVEGVEITLTGIDLDLDFDQKTIKKVSFVALEYVITWKPKVKKEVFEGGFKQIRTLPMTLETIPTKLKELGSNLRENQKVRLNVEYFTLEGERDGNKVLYRFITSEKTFNKWQIVG